MVLSDRYEDEDVDIVQSNAIIRCVDWCPVVPVLVCWMVARSAAEDLLQIQRMAGSQMDRRTGAE